MRDSPPRATIFAFVSTDTAARGGPPELGKLPILTGKSIVCFGGEDWWYHHPHSKNHKMPPRIC
jgi:hypothetical protein